MQTKQALKVLGTILFLYGIFGYLFPEWGGTVFSENENLFHLVTGLAAVFMSNFSLLHRKWTLLVLAILYLALGIYGFSAFLPADIHIKSVTIKAHIDEFDNYVNLIIGLISAYIWLQGRKQK